MSPTRYGRGITLPLGKKSPHFWGPKSVVLTFIPFNVIYEYFLHSVGTEEVGSVDTAHTGVGSRQRPILNMSILRAYPRQVGNIQDSTL